MNDTGTLREHLPGDARERARRDELLRALLSAFERGGQGAVTDELKARMGGLLGDFAAAVEALRAKF
jgi:hypothetical protein